MILGVESRLAIAALVLGVAVAGCAEGDAVERPAPTNLPTPVNTSQPDHVDTPAAESPTQGAPEQKQLPLEVEVTDVPESEPQISLGSTELQLQAEIPISRSDFGVRFAFSPTGDTLLHSGSGLQIQRFGWDSESNLGDINGFENFPPFTISLSADGSTIVADDGPLIRVWDSSSGDAIGQLELAPFSTIIDAGFQSDDLYFAVDYFGNVALWDPNGWGEISRFSAPGRIDSGLLLPGGQAVALQDRDRNEILIFNLDGEQTGSIPIEDQFAELLFGSPEADRILLHVNRGLPSEGIKIISMETGATELNIRMLNYRYFAVSTSWDRLAAMDVFNRLRIYSLPDGELLLEQELPGVIRTLGLAMSPGASHLAAYVLKDSGKGGAIQIWGAPE